MEERVSWAFNVGSARALHVLHHSVGRHDKREAGYFLAVYSVSAESEQTDCFVGVVQYWSTGIPVRCGGVGLKNWSATRSLFPCGDLAVVDSGFERRLAAEESGVKSVSRAGITDDGDVVLKLDLV